MTDVPVRDMAAWVNRPVDERLEEAKKRKGYITRPMNSFMLYRSAYAERTKAWCAENNHQVVSSVSGESWPLEPPEVREFYNDLAKVERANHQNAHPDYKFSPAKPGLAGRKRRGTGDSDDESPDSDDDPDADWGSSHKRTKNRRPGRDAGYPARSRATAGDGSFDDGYARSTWEANNLGRPLPSAIGHHNLYGNQYYQTQVQPHPYMMPGVEDVKFTTDMQGYGPSTQSLIGLPGQSHYELQALHSQSSTPIPVGAESQVDPMLLGSYDSQAGISLDETLTLTQSVPYDTATYTTADYTSGYQATGHEFTEGSNWHPDVINPAFEQPSEFDKYWDDAHYAGANDLAAMPPLSRRESVEHSKTSDKAMAKALSAALVSPKSKSNS
jgi:HMG (high mobility group) box